MAGIYIHIPFCKQACHYCDFHFSTNLSRRDELCDAIEKEIALRKNYLKDNLISTIYFGGGTPSLLEVRQIESILNRIKEYFTVESGAEITLEANPDDLSEQKLSSLKTIGINRLSIGIQSFDDEILKLLNRAHNVDMAIKSVLNAKSSGIRNISIDLIYAIPGLSDLAWIHNIEKAISLQPTHISCYALTIEEKTVFGNWYKKGKLNKVADENEARQLELLITLLHKAGYLLYEVSNFCLPGYESKHNSSYWKQTHYLGLGPAAHSYNSISRQFNVANNHKYIAEINAGIIPASIETLTTADKINEYLLTSLRTQWGCNLIELKSLYDYDIMQKQAAYISSLLSEGFADIKQEHLVLTTKGLLLADKIASDLFVA
ncbi:MAG TPA: radical SAM family heme chaperone HemW [Cyclobacteriaceae bacterium]|nr:radical SAM family heme chaperone HemW [Cyclobacteriaceae bacterium]